MMNDAELKTIYANENYKANAQGITQECSEFPVKGSELSHQDCSKLRVVVPL